MNRAVNGKTQNGIRVMAVYSFMSLPKEVGRGIYVRQKSERQKEIKCCTKGEQRAESRKTWVQWESRDEKRLKIIDKNSPIFGKKKIYKQKYLKF